MAYGEVCLLHAIGKNYTECGILQSGKKNEKCSVSHYTSSDVALWHAGGNWGDIWSAPHNARLASFREMQSQNISVLGMPQSLNYSSIDQESKDAVFINGTVEKGLLLHLSWRERESLERAKKIYPQVHNFLSPDIAFMVGPISDSRYFTKESIPNVDVLFLLRNDKEGIIGGHERVRGKLTTLFQNMSTSWTVVDWDDCNSYFNETSDGSPVQEVPHSGAFDHIKRISSCVAMYATASIVVTDRLHGSIFALLMSKPHIFIDQTTLKISRTRNVALGTTGACKNGGNLRYAHANDLDESISIVQRFLAEL